MPRLPRFTRSQSIPRFALTSRDREIVRAVYLHRFLRSSDIAKLIDGSQQHILRRLQLLFHNGYLTRPRAQLDYYTKGGSREIVYGLGNRGAKLLRDSGVKLRHLRWSEKNQSVGRMFLQHALLVSRIMVSFEIACRQDIGVKFTRNESLPPANARTLQWRVKINSRMVLGVVPDALFTLERMPLASAREHEYFFLEADRGTMPVVRKNLKQTSMLRKLLAYEATWKNEIHTNRLGLHRFRVLIVTVSADRLDHLVKAASELESGRGLFLFCSESDMRENSSILTTPLVTANGQTITLVDPVDTNRS